MSRYIDVGKQLVRLHRMGLSCEDVVKQFLLTATIADIEEVRHGHWVYDKGDCFPKCSVCRQHNGTLYEYRYCPTCEALMDGDVEYA